MPGRIYTITLTDAQTNELLTFLGSADDGEGIIKVLREQITRQHPVQLAAMRAVAIQSIQQVAEEYFERASATESAEMRRCWTSDGADVRYIAECLAANTPAMDAEAKRHTASLDTAVRDEIPREAWTFVGLRALR